MAKTISPIRAAGYICGTDYLATLLGVSRTQVSHYVHAGMPKRARGEFYLPEALGWLFDRKRREPDPATGETPFDELHRAQRVLVELQTQRKRETLLPRDLVTETFARVQTVIGAELDALNDPSLVKELTDSDDPVQIQQRLFEISREVRRRIAQRLRDLGTSITSGETARGE